MTCVYHIYMKNPQHTCIEEPVQIVPIFLGYWIIGIIPKDHDVLVRCAGIDNVLSPPNIIGGIVDTKNPMFVEPVILEKESINVFDVVSIHVLRSIIDNDGIFGTMSIGPFLAHHFFYTRKEMFF